MVKENSYDNIRRQGMILEEFEIGLHYLHIKGKGEGGGGGSNHHSRSRICPPPSPTTSNEHVNSTMELI